MDSNDPVPSGINVSARFASATARLRVDNKDPNMHYVWKRPDELRQAAYEGYKIAKGTNLRTFSGRPDSEVHRVGAMGDDELILMQIPGKLAEERQRAVGEKSKKRIERFDDASAEEIEKSGKALRDGSPQRGQGSFTPTR
jgi:hypothetical protein